jgi:hypothetical protein
VQLDEVIIVPVADYEYPAGVQAMGWMVELYPLTFTILVGAWVVVDNYRKKLSISVVRYRKKIGLSHRNVLKYFKKRLIHGQEIAVSAPTFVFQAKEYNLKRKIAYLSHYCVKRAYYNITENTYQ